MAVNLKDLRTAIYEVITTLTGQEVIWQNQNAPTPAGDFIILKITSLQMQGNDWQSSPIDCIVETQGDREVVLGIIAVSQDAMGILLELENKLELYSTLELMTNAKMAYVGRDGDIIDITTEINGSFESRASVDLRFRISKNYSSPTRDSIKSVEGIGYEGSFEDSDITINESI
jgi:hypothetical protein